MPLSLGLQVNSKICTGDLVDIWRPTLSKDVPRWNGPATVVDLTAIPDGIIGVRWQGRNLQIRVQDCRRALAFMFGRNPMNANPVAKLTDFDLCTEPTREPTREWCHGGWDSLELGIGSLDPLRCCSFGGVGTEMQNKQAANQIGEYFDTASRTNQRYQDDRP